MTRDDDLYTFSCRYTGHARYRFSSSRRVTARQVPRDALRDTWSEPVNEPRPRSLFNGILYGALNTVNFSFDARYSFYRVTPRAPIFFFFHILARERYDRIIRTLFLASFPFLALSKLTFELTFETRILILLA